MSSGAEALNFNDIEMIGVGGLSGGFGSMIGGGDFWTGARQGLIMAGLNHALHRLVPQNSWPVDKQLNEIGIDPNGVPDFSLDSINTIEKLSSIEKLLKTVSRPTVELGAGDEPSQYINGKLTMRIKDFSSWRRLATAYGHEMVHRIVDMKLSQILINKKGIILRAFNEGMAYRWSYKYSGEGFSAYHDFRSEFILDKTYRNLYNKYRIEP